MHFSAVAPPRGERGLKSKPFYFLGNINLGRSPSWGAWIEILNGEVERAVEKCRSPSWGAWIEISFVYVARIGLPSLPLVGSVD